MSAPAGSNPEGTGEPFLSRMGRFLDRPVDDLILTWAFRGLVIGAIVMLAIDIADMRRAERAAGSLPFLSPASDPAELLPTIRPAEDVPGMTLRPGSTGGAPTEPMTIELVGGGRLLLTGLITPGTADRLAAELDQRGDYVDRIVLASPGGAVTDAMAMSRMIRERGLATAVEDGGYCASSCPLVFAGGVERTASGVFDIGVHQIFAAEDVGTLGQGMAEAQRVTAEAQRLLIDMDVDPRVWIHAMETPKDALFYFTAEELLDLKLATRVD